MDNPKQPDQINNQFPEKDWSKATYSFTLEEKNKLLSLDTISQIGQVAQIMISNLIQSQCLARVGINNDPETRVIYDIPSGQFCIYTPRKKVEVLEEKKT